MPITWLKKGVEAQKAFQKAEAETKAKQEQNTKAFRFWLPQGKEARITFVDGFLTGDENNLLDYAAYREHQLYMNGSYQNWYVCIDTGQPGCDPCPICVGGDTPSFVGALTIIDHTKYTGKNGKVYENTKRLFVAKRDTIKLLQQLAVKRGGLAGCTFDAMRIGEKSPNVGSQFDFIEKNSIEDLKKKYMTKDDQGKIIDFFTPLDYTKEITFLTREELIARGFGPAPISNAAAAVTVPAGNSAPQQDYSNQL